MVEVPGRPYAAWSQPKVDGGNNNLADCCEGVGEAIRVGKSEKSDGAKGLAIDMRSKKKGEPIG